MFERKSGEHFLMTTVLGMCALLCLGTLQAMAGITFKQGKKIGTFYQRKVYFNDANNCGNHYLKGFWYK
jgi:hypothetical protein